MQNCLKDIQHDGSFLFLEEECHNILNQNKTIIQYKKGEVILKQGTIANNVVYTKNGLYKLTIEGDQKNAILTFKGSKVFLGLSSVYYHNNTYLYSVTALEDCEVEMYDMKSFKNILNSNVLFANEIIKILNHNSARFFMRFMNMTEKNARGKVANMILCLGNSVYFSDDYLLTISRKDMAEFLGNSVENIIRILREFENDELIKMTGKRVKILNHDALQRICDFG